MQTYTEEHTYLLDSRVVQYLYVLKICVAYTYIHIYIHTYILSCTLTHIHTRIDNYIYIENYIYIHIYIIHTHI